MLQNIYEKALNGYIREYPYDMTVIQEIFAGEQRQNDRDGATAVAMSEVYVFLVPGYSSSQ